jgi:hypothetical protein
MRWALLLPPKLVEAEFPYQIWLGVELTTPLISYQYYPGTIENLLEAEKDCKTFPPIPKKSPSRVPYS